MNLLEQLERLGLARPHRNYRHPLAGLDRRREMSGLVAKRPVRSAGQTKRDRAKAMRGRKVRRAQLIAAKKR